MSSSKRPNALLYFILAVTSAPFSVSAQTLSPNQQLARDIYKELVEIDTVTATGDTAKAAEAMAARLRAAGFPDADVHAFSPAPHKGNLVARLRGSGARKPILLVAHIDVVPASREDWSTDPFKLIEQDGYFYARGSGDDKYMAASFIANLIRYRQEGYKPDRDIMVTLNETTRAYFERTAQMDGGQVADDLRAVLSGQTDPTALAVVRLTANPGLNAQLRTTCVATMLEGGVAI